MGEPLTTSDDPLENVTYFQGECRVCGNRISGGLKQDVSPVWAACFVCGHVFALDNRVRWQ
jgi:hypothetical protein